MMIKRLYFFIPIKGESVGYTVKSMDKEFPISNYPLEQTEFLYDSKLGKVDFILWFMQTFSRMLKWLQALKFKDFWKSAKSTR